MFDGPQTNIAPASIRFPGLSPSARGEPIGRRGEPDRERPPSPAERATTESNGAPPQIQVPQGDDLAKMADPERQLWCAVLIHALYEASGRVAYAERGQHQQIREAAIAWFEDAGDDFHAVCDLAGFPPAAIRDHALRVIRGRRLPRIRISKVA